MGNDSAVLAVSHREPVGSLPPLGPTPSVWIFGLGALVTWIATRQALPWVLRSSGEPMLFWFATATALLFGPMLVLGFLLLRQEGATFSGDALRSRLRLGPLNRADWRTVAAGLVAIVVGTVALVGLIRVATGAMPVTPDFMLFEPLRGARLWLLAAWVPFFVLNIAGEELVWRGVVLPRQEAALGRLAWLVNGAGWLLFHVAFGLHVMVMLLPICFVLPYVVQRTGKTWIGIVLHAAFNGPGFLVTAFGLMPAG